VSFLRRSRFACVLGLGICSCSAEATTQPRTVTVRARPLSPSPTNDADTQRAPEAPTQDALASLGPSQAPGLRELSRGESPLPASIPIPPSSTDVCVRAVLASSGPVTAALLGEGRVLAMSEAGRVTWLDVRGPICLKKGTEAHIEVQGGAGVVRYVLWMGP
jgi:hypothetical protein